VCVSEYQSRQSMGLFSCFGLCCVGSEQPHWSTHHFTSILAFPLASLSQLLSLPLTSAGTRWLPLSPFERWWSPLATIAWCKYALMYLHRLPPRSSRVECLCQSIAVFRMSRALVSSRSALVSTTT
jgi:hypothetical protein